MARGSGGHHVPGWAALRGDGAAVGQELAGVVEEDHAVAQQAPALLGESGDHFGRFAVSRLRGWAGRFVLAHRILRMREVVWRLSHAVMHVTNGRGAARVWNFQRAEE